MKVWLLGASGMLGQAVAQRLERAQIPFVGTGHEVDITAGPTVLAFAGDHRASHIINCAAYTKVDACEAEEATATLVNGAGPDHVARAALLVGGTALHVSTDYVFDGAGVAPYDEEAPCAPLGAYGRTKRAGEVRFLAAFGTGGAAQGFVVRTSWLYGHGGTGNFVRTMLRLMKSRDELGVVADQMGRPTYCDDLAGALVRLAGVVQPPIRRPQPGIYHYANTGATSWHGFAAEIRQQALALGIELACQKVRPLTTEQYPTPAKRPAYSVLSTEKVSAALGEAPPPWRTALQTYMNRWAQAPE